MPALHSLTDKDHPVWKIILAVVVIVGLNWLNASSFDKDNFVLIGQQLASAFALLEGGGRVLDRLSKKDC